MTLTVSIPNELETQLRQRADAARLEVPQFVEQILRHEIAASVSVSGAAESAAELDRAYERGYAMVPEGLSLTNALLPFLSVDAEAWE